MEHKNFVKIYHHDTDCYGVVWHGSYIKWFEVGRVELSNLLGISINDIEKEGINFPVVELNCRYKTPAKLMDELCIVTSIKELKPTSVVFKHLIENTNTKQIVLEASSTIVTTQNGKLLRKMPEFMYEKYSRAL